MYAAQLRQKPEYRDLQRIFEQINKYRNDIIILHPLT